MLKSENYTSSQVKELIQDIAMGVSTSSGDAFFEKLVLHLWKLYKMSHILVGLYNKSDNSVATLKFCVDGKIVDNIHYSLEHTPCADVVCNTSAVYTKEVQKDFPKDQFFKEYDIESYLGIRLVDSVGVGVGVIACLDKSEIEYPETMHAILEIFASRASVEIERMQNEQHLETRVKERTQELENALHKIKKQTHAQLLDSEKMSSLGSMVAGFTHDINTPIGLSITGVSYIQAEAKKITKAIETGTLSKTALNEYLENSVKMAEAMAKSLDKAKELVRSFKLISVDQHLNNTKLIHLKAYVDDILLSLHFKLKHTQIRVNNNIPMALDLSTQASVFFQIFGNLILNSIKHGFDGNEEGQIDIDAKQENDILYIKYKDSGKGMNKETLKHVFEQFYTTKKDDGGTGLGMYILYDLIVNTMGGKINVVSEIDQGTEFNIEVPIKQA